MQNRIDHPRSSLFLFVPGWFVPFREWALFTADDGNHGREIWASDGTEAGTRMLRDILEGPGNGATILERRAIATDPAGPTLFFQRDDGFAGNELWALPLAELVTPCAADRDQSGSVTADEIVAAVATSAGSEQGKRTIVRAVREALADCI